jgi:FtsH-binding integral membrane protein
MTPGASATLPQVGTVAIDQRRVLRNTYWLLALSLLPTIAGAFAGMQLNFIALFKAAPIMTPLLMFGAMLGSLWVVTLLRNSAWGVAALFGFTFISGLMLTPILTVAAGFSNGGQLVALSGGLTAAVFFALASYATVSKRDFSFLGRFLFVGLILLIVASLANLFFQVPVVALSISAIAVLLFSMYLLYDLSNIVRGGETNYVMATLGLFLDLFNIFISLLNLLLAFSGQRD